MKNKEFIGSLDTNPLRLNYYISYFALYVNGKQIPSGSLHLDTGHEKTSVMAYSTLFDASGIHHSNSGLQITHDINSRVFSTTLDPTPDRGASEGHSSYPDSGNIRIELKI